MKEFLNQIHPVDDATLEAYLAYWKPCRVPKKTVMTAEGETERYMYYVREGIQKAFCLERSKEHIVAFTYPPSFSGVLDSFLTQLPSTYYLETITNSQFMRLSYEKHQQLIEKHRPIETLFRKATEAFSVGMMQRYKELMAFDIETRFRTFAARSPHLLNMVSQKDLASYLRIDATNLSKLLGRLKI
ncbi:MAG: Crp/Fnr family transcriptional regulator [Tunicatimonas sp.]